MTATSFSSILVAASQLIFHPHLLVFEILPWIRMLDRRDRFRSMVIAYDRREKNASMLST